METDAMGLRGTGSVGAEPEFDAAYRKARRDAFGQAVARLQHGTLAAATTLLKVLIDQSTPASVKVRAAEAISAKAIEIGGLKINSGLRAASRGSIFGS